MKHLALVLAFGMASCLHAAIPVCPAGMPLGSIELTARRTEQTPPLPLSKLNQLEEGDQILYAPSLRSNEKRRGEITVVLVATYPPSEGQPNFAVLEAQDASKPAQWKVPFRAALAAYVYGPSGLSARKLKGFLAKDQELVSQLADYAEKTAQTEAVLHALASYDTSGSSDNLGAALHGFAGQFGISNKIDRSAPLNQQTLAALQTLNPALSAYDPISPSGMQRVSQTAGLAATVAGMFLGSTVGLAAGSTAMALNLKTLLFPDTDFRSAYGQALSGNTVALCTSREPVQSRKRIGYLWAMRLPDAGPPAIRVDKSSHVPVGLKTPIQLDVPEPQWKLVSRAREWTLTGGNGQAIPVPATPLADRHALELNLSGIAVPPGPYALKGVWDWEPFTAEGSVHVHPLDTFSQARLTPGSQNRLLQHSGKQVVTLTGGDFQFVEKAAMLRQGDKYDKPVAVPFSLPQGLRQGPQDTVEMQIDTTGFSAGEYALLLYQQGGQPQTINVKVLHAPPKLDHLPLIVNQGETESRIELEGEGLERITALAAEGMSFELDADSSPHKRVARVRPLQDVTANTAPGASLDMRVSVQDYAEPLVLAQAVKVAGPKPRILEANPSLPADLQIALRAQELPVGVYMGIMMRVAHAGSEPAVELGCKNTSATRITVQAGSEKDRIKLQTMQADALFLSLDPGLWPSGCLLTVAVQNKGTGKSAPFELGRVVRLPKIESFRLTEEAAPEGGYIGVLTGRDLELIEKAGWDAQNGNATLGLPAPLAGEGDKQSLRIRLSWPSPTPHAPVFVWLRGEAEGRLTQVRY